MTDREFLPLDIAVLTVSDTRNEQTDKSGALLAGRVRDGGHKLADKRIVPDDIPALRATVGQWIADPGIDVVITTGGTGLPAKTWEMSRRLGNSRYSSATFMIWRTCARAPTGSKGAPSMVASAR